MLLACLWAGVGPSIAQALPRTPEAGHAQPGPLPEDRVRVAARQLDARHGPSGPPPDDSPLAPVRPVDANHATAGELQTLRGVGPAMAERIIAARTERPFDSFEDFSRRVRGAGQKRLQQWRAAGLILHPASSPIQRTAHLQPGQIQKPAHIREAPARTSAHVWETPVQTPAHVRETPVQIPAGKQYRMPPEQGVRAGSLMPGQTTVVPVETIVGYPLAASPEVHQAGRKPRRRTQASLVSPAGARRGRVNDESSRTGSRISSAGSRILRTEAFSGPRRSHPSGGESTRRASMAAGCQGASRAKRQLRTGRTVRHEGRAGGQVRSSLPSMFDTQPLFGCDSLFDERSRLAPRS